MSRDSDQSPLVTIGMPVRNGARFLDGAFGALLGQDFTDFEIVVSDNASTDETEQICRKYATLDSRIRYVRQISNLGVVGNFNYLLSQARGKYFMFAAADDLWAPEFLSQALRILEADSSVAVAFPRVEYIDEHGKKIGEPISVEYPARNAVVRLAAFALIYRDHFFYGVMRRAALGVSTLRRWWPPNQDVYIDSAYPFLCELLCRGRVVSLSGEPLFKCRIWPHEHAGEKLYPQSLAHYLLLKFNVLTECLRAIYRGTNSLIMPVLVSPVFLLRFLIEVAKGIRYPRIMWQRNMGRRFNRARIWLEQHLFWRWMGD